MKKNGRLRRRTAAFGLAAFLPALFLLLAFPEAVIAEQTGSLLVKTIPRGAEILLNGRSMGTAPLLLQGVPTGTTRLKAHHSGYRPWGKVVRIKPGERHEVILILARE